MESGPREMTTTKHTYPSRMDTRLSNSTFDNFAPGDMLEVFQHTINATFSSPDEGYANYTWTKDTLNKRGARDSVKAVQGRRVRDDDLVPH